MESLCVEGEMDNYFLIVVKLEREKEQDQISIIERTLIPNLMESLCMEGEMDNYLFIVIKLKREKQQDQISIIEKT